MTDRVIDDRFWRAHEVYLRYSSHALAAWNAAHHKTTPVGLKDQLLERHARFTLRANEARKQAKELEQ